MRIRDELLKSKKIIEESLNKKVNFICWPGGGNNAMVRRIAREVGYEAWTLGSKDLSNFKNIPDANPEKIKRVSTCNKVQVKGYGRGRGGSLYQLLKIRKYQDSFFHKQLLKGYKLISCIKM